MINRNIAAIIESEPNLEKKVTLVLEDNGTRDYMTVKDLIEQIESDMEYAEKEDRLEEFLNTEVLMLSSDIEGQNVNSNPQLIVGWCGESFILSGNINSIDFAKFDIQDIDLAREEVIKMKSKYGNEYKYDGKRELLQSFYFSFNYGTKYYGMWQKISAINFDKACDKMFELYDEDWLCSYTEKEFYLINSELRRNLLPEITLGGIE